MILPAVVNIAKICAAKGVRHVVLSPGSRNASLAIAFVRHPKIEVKTVSDERSAAFIALGMARKTRNAVAIVCTSGSAAYNYAPAIAEAFFQQIPLLVITADRPPEWIDQLDGQTIRQQGIYGNHIKESYELPVGQTSVDIHFSSRIMSEAINSAVEYPMGPVHVNVPIREPFYPEEGEILDFTEPVKVIGSIEGQRQLSSDQLDELTAQLSHYQKSLIICGQHFLDETLRSTISEFSSKSSIPVVTDIISNFQGVSHAIQHADVFLGSNDEQFLKDLQPDLVITFGLSVMSKNLKLYLRKYAPKAQWHIQPYGKAADTYLALTQVIESNVLSFFKGLSDRVPDSHNDYSFFNSWKDANNKAKELLKEFFVKDEEVRSSEFHVVLRAMQELPAYADLHLANSMSVRYANLVGLNSELDNIEVFANRGTSGIDGSNSTAIGTALVSGKLTLLITGDLAFFYDRNAFWHNYQVPNLRILLLNNHGGGIFRMINGPGRQPEAEEFFVTKQSLEAENTAMDFGMAYQQIDLSKINNSETLNEGLAFLLSESATHVKLLEVITDGQTNTHVFGRYKQLVRQLVKG